MTVYDWYNLLIVIYVIGGICYASAYSINRPTLARFTMGIWIFSMLIYTANRPVDVGTDTLMYQNIFSVYATGIPFDLIPVQQQLNYVFYLVGQLATTFSTEFDIFLYCVSGLFLLSTYAAFKLIFKSSWHLPFFIFASSFIYYSFLFNLIRNSLIVGGTFWGLYLFFYNPTLKRQIFGGAILVAMFFVHSSAGFIAIAVGISYFIKSERVALYVWFGVMLASLAGLDMFKLIQGIVYTLFPSSTLAFKTGVYDQVTKSTGFRIDFVLYTIFFGLIGYAISIKWKDPFYASIVKWYLIQGSLFMLFFSFPYVDRIASLAWMAFPLLIGYPTVFWKGLRPYRFQVSVLTFLFGIVNLVLVARYDFHLNIF